MTRTRAAEPTDPDDGPPASAEPPGQGSPDAAATDEAAAAPPAGHAADPPPDEPDQDAADGGDTTVETQAGPVTAAGGEVRGGRAADLGPAMPEGVPYAVAREPLYIANPEAATAAVRAFNAGDRVPAELIDKFGWHDLTDLPEWATAPPAPAPEQSEEQN